MNDSSVNRSSVVGRTSVDRVRQPINNFAETKTYLQILEKAKSQKRLILHCHGYSGSGKSEIVRNLAKLFPYTGGSSSTLNKSLYVKWHIQCRDSNHDVKAELNSLVEALRTRFLLPAKQRHHVQDILKNIEDNLAFQLTNALVSTQVPILVIIEDVKPVSKDLLKDFFRSLENVDEDDIVKFHIYVTARRKEALLSEDEINTMTHFLPRSIKGFRKDEGVDFLLKDHQKSNEERQAAKSVWSAFSGSPLGLCAAKTCCKDTRISYEDYCKWLQRYHTGNVDDYSEELTKEYGESVLSIFRAIAMTFHETDCIENHAKLMWKVLTILTYFHYDRIPLIAVQRCCQEVRGKHTTNISLTNKIEAGKIITKLLDHGMCTVTDEDDVTFHEVVMLAFRHEHYGQPLTERINSLESAVYVIAGIITKDMRKKDASRTMEKMLRHVSSVLRNVAKMNLLYHTVHHMMPVLISYIFDIFGVIASAKAPNLRKYVDGYFENALKLIWEKDPHYSLLGPADNQGEIEKIAEYVVRNCEVAGMELPENFVINFESKIFPSVDERICCSITKCLTEKRIISEDYSMSNLWEERSPEVLIQTLRECGCFLKEYQHKRVFFAERLASIFHSWSRAIVYRDLTKPEDYERYEWFSELSGAISAACRRLCDVGLLTERISQTGGKISIILKRKPEQESTLLETKEECERALNSSESESIVLYEHGLLIDDKPSDLFMQIQMHRNLVRIYTRLVTKPGGVKYVAEGNKRCDALYEMANASLKNFASSLMCLVYCAKYYAASGNCALSIKCFEIYFEEEECHPQIKGVHAWAVYNYARAVVVGKSNKHREKVIEKCKKCLSASEVIAEDLSEKIAEVLKRLIDFECK